MPYIITTTKRVPVAGHIDPIQVSSHVIRCAVATLDEARNYVQPILTDAADTTQWEMLHDALDDLPETGGTLRLPSGMVVEIAHVHWNELTEQVPMPAEYERGQFAAILDAYNAAQGL